MPLRLLPISVCHKVTRAESNVFVCALMHACVWSHLNQQAEVSPQPRIVHFVESRRSTSHSLLTNVSLSIIHHGSAELTAPLGSLLMQIQGNHSHSVCVYICSGFASVPLLQEGDLIASPSDLSDESENVLATSGIDRVNYIWKEPRNICFNRGCIKTVANLKFKRCEWWWAYKKVALIS